jgi:hypothetical protein
VSSTHLTSDNINLIERWLSEVRESGSIRNFDRVTATARLLIQRVEQGTTNEDELRSALARRVGLHEIMEGALGQWDGEGSAIGNAP